MALVVLLIDGEAHLPIVMGGTTPAFFNQLRCSTKLKAGCKGSVVAYQTLQQLSVMLTLFLQSVRHKSAILNRPLHLGRAGH